MMTAPPTQAAFYREFIMARKLDPREYGVDMDREAFAPPRDGRWHRQAPMDHQRPCDVWPMSGKRCRRQNGLPG